MGADDEGGAAAARGGDGFGFGQIIEDGAAIGEIGGVF